MFKRKIYDYLKAWKEESDGMSAVMVEGARRVGKSTVVESSTVICSQGNRIGKDPSYRKGIR